MPNQNRPNQNNNKPKAGNTKRKAAKRSDRQYRRATRNTQLEMQPTIDSLNAQMQQRQADSLRQMQMADATYGGAAESIRGLPTPDFGGISDDFASRVGSLANAFTAQVPGNEAAAGANLGATIGAGGLENLSSFAAQNAATQQGRESEAHLSKRYARDSVQQDLTDDMQLYNNQLRNLYAQMPSMIEQERDELRRESVENKLAKSQMRESAAFSDYLQDMLGNQMGPNRPPGGPADPRRNNNGPGPRSTGGTDFKGAGTVSHATIDNMGANNAPFRDNPYADRPNAPRRSAVPRAWSNAETYADLPGLVQNAYERPSGQTLRGAFQTSQHPSFNNFRDFRVAYEDFLRQINQLYRSGHNFGQ